MAAEYLEGQGYRILERNFKSSHGEIDIIAKKGEYLVFFECKYRADDGCGDPLAAVDTRKQRHICKTALYYLAKKGYGTDCACRFDVIAVYGNQSVRHIENAFAYCG